MLKLPNFYSSFQFLQENHKNHKFINLKRHKRTFNFNGDIVFTQSSNFAQSILLEFYSQFYASNEKFCAGAVRNISELWFNPPLSPP